MSHPDPDIEALLKGDDAWGRLYLRCKDRMYAAARGVLGNSDEAHDAVQEAFRSLMKAGPDCLREVIHVRGYFASVAKYKALDIVSRDDRLDFTDAELAPPKHHDIDPAEVVAQEEALALGFDLVDQMPEKVQYAYRERHLKGRKAMDVANELDVDPSYINRLVRQGAEFIATHNPYTDPTPGPLPGDAPGTKEST